MYFGELAPLLDAVTESRTFDLPTQALSDYKKPVPLVVLSNRIPFSVEYSRTERSVSGLASSVEAAMQEGPRAVWLGWNGSFEDSGTWIYQAPHSSLTIVGMPINRNYLEKYYSHVCNSYLFPLYCGSWSESAKISSLDWHAYSHVNRIIAEEACRVADQGATVWVNDFHLQLCPRLIKDKRPDLHVVYFQHIPFPSAKLFGQIPWRTEILNSISKADRVGLQTSRDRRNLLSCLARFGRGNTGILMDDEHSHPLSYPRSSSIIVAPAEIDTRWWRGIRRDPFITERAAALRNLIGSPDHVFLGVDRLEPTKGIAEKIAAFMRLDQENEVRRGAVLLQVAVASDPRSLHGSEAILHDIRDELSKAPANPGGYPAIYLTTVALSREEVAILYSAADTLVVTSLSEGMNLVVKEFVAFKGWDHSRLVISKFAGVAEDLPAELLVNPHDIDEVTEALRRAIMNSGETTRRTPRFVNSNAIDWMHKLLGDLH